MRGDDGVAGKGIVVGVSRFHSWGKCTMQFILRLMLDCLRRRSSPLVPRAPVSFVLADCHCSNLD